MISVETAVFLAGAAWLAFGIGLLLGAHREQKRWEQKLAAPMQPFIRLRETFPPSDMPVHFYARDVIDLVEAVDE